MAEQIFVSYARDDDTPPPEKAAAKGFVTFLIDQLRYEFVNTHGQPRPNLWQDKRNIDHGDQFDPVIANALEESSILLVVMSRNWLYRPYCLYELETFAKRWGGADPLDVKRRIIVVAKNYVNPTDRPALLQGQEGYGFFHLEEPAEAGQEYAFFERGEVRDDRYYGLIRGLGSQLWRVAQRQGPAIPAAAPAQAAAAPEAPVPEAPPAADPDRRTIYLAKPAADMRQPYQRVVEELGRRGFNVVPPPGVEIPSDDGAVEFVDGAMATAEAAVHLLGERLGYAPENAEPITKLQLAASARRAEEPVPAGAPTFRRIIWAPRVVPDAGDPAAPKEERDPLAVLARFDRQAASDKIESRALSDFVTFLVAYLDSTTPRAPEPEALQANGSVYIYHQTGDTGYAVGLGKALKARHIRAMFPALEGDPADLEATHRRKLAECDAIVLCWANASEVWVHAQSDELKDWREFGRKRKFAFRGVIAGPPPGIRKEVFVEFPPSDDIDIVLDLTSSDKPLPEALDPLVLATNSEPT